ncbi:MAG: cadmium-translocating P-type ATPase [Clostridiales bacterium]|nr:cadmium-translocating P-type ATPase [Clostridiales bacterium]
MKKYKLILQGLNCAHCAGLIEEKISKQPEYENVTFDFVNKILTFETSEKVETLAQRIQGIVDSIENGVEVKLCNDEHHDENRHGHGECECGCCHGHNHNIDAENEDAESERKNGFFGKARPLAAGCTLFAISLVTPYILKNEYAFRGMLILQIAAVLIAGYKIFLKGIKNILKLRADENFLLLLAVTAAFCIGETTEAAVVTLLFVLGNFIEDYAVDRSRKSIKKLASIRPDKATVLENGEEISVSAEKIKPNTTIIVAPHERVPIDAVVTKGGGFADCSTITGESIPVEITEGTTLLSGTINGDCVLQMKTLRPYSESAASRIIKIVEEASAVKGKSEKFITKFAKVYTPIVILAAAAIVILGTLLGAADFKEMLYRGLVVLVASCPCAVVISVPLGFYSGIGAASKKGVLIKGSKFLEVLSKADCVAFDKTGTLTTGKLRVSNVKTYGEIDEKQAKVLAAACEKYSSHPLAEALKNETDAIDLPVLINYNEIAGKGVTAEYNDKSAVFGNALFLRENGILTNEKHTCMLAIDGKLMAGFDFSDSIRTDVQEVVKNLESGGFKNIAILTGDKKEYAESIAAQCGIENVYAELLPQEKVDVMQRLSENSKASVFVGDGINDAPILAAADCGIAMGLGSEAAIEAADAVLSDGNIKQLPACIKTAKRAMRVIKSNIAFAIAFKLAVLVLAALGAAPIWLAVAADTGVSVICILNSTLNVK